MPPLICTVDGFGTVDYGVPIVANKFTDYRTTTGTYHRFIPDVTREYDIRVKPRINKELLEKNVEIAKYSTSTSYKSAYQGIGFGADVSMNAFRAGHNQDVHFTRTVQEKICREPLRPILPGLSEMKASYTLKEPILLDPKVYPPEPYAKCEIQSLGRDEQPQVAPEMKGFWKLTDPYLTTSRKDYIPFTPDQLSTIGRKDIITFYDAAGVPKCKGFGPRNAKDIRPLVTRKDAVVDEAVSCRLLRDGVVHVTKDRVPHNGITTTYNGSFKDPTYSHIYPYLFDNGVDYKVSAANPSPTQVWSIPGMYTTDYSHISTQKPVNSVIATDIPEYGHIHEPCCLQVK